jgi:3-methyladenine DNA glycosylase AlkD
MAALRAEADPQIATIYGRRNPGVEVIGVRFGDLGPLAKRIGKDHGLAMRLWGTGLLDARFLAMMIDDPAELTRDEIDGMVRDLDFPTLADMFAHDVYVTPWAESYMRRWTKRKAEFVRRAGYVLAYDFAADPNGAVDDDELRAMLVTIENEIHGSANWAREMMNMVPVAIGKGRPALAEQALATAEGYGPVEVFHGDHTRCKVWDAAEALRDPKVRVKAPARRLAGATASRSPRR